MTTSRQKTEDIIAENKRRTALLSQPYNPYTGEGCCGNRIPTELKWEEHPVLLPEAMLSDPAFKTLGSEADYFKLRHRHDFEHWACTCVKIRHKITGRQVPFILNRPQRRVLAEIEADRRAGKPLRLIMLKARQWGGSTLIQMYFAWIQTVHRKNWHSLICAQVKNTAATIRGMYTTMLNCYPAHLWQGDEPPKFRPYEGSATTREIAGRKCTVTLASSFGQDAMRGLDCAMAHLSEVAFWKSSDNLSPEDFIRAVCGGVALTPFSFIALESTANGVGNFFHSEWLQAKSGISDRRAIFVPWYEIEMNRLPCHNPEALIDTMTDYDWRLWDDGCTLEQINWYRQKRQDMSSDTAMHAEYPTDDIEAFANTGNAVFTSAAVERLRLDCRTATYTGDITGAAATGQQALENIRFVSSADGNLKIWSMPDHNNRTRNRYVTAVDVGGRSHGSDYSVIAVFDRMPGNGHPYPELAAQWRGHCDHDLLGWKAAAISRFYNNALLIIESNTLETDTTGSSQYILEELNHTYRNLYVRQPRDSTHQAPPSPRIGFHTNRTTKNLLITSLIAMVRDHAYTERDTEACNEMATYEQLPNGSFAAKRGYHDDILMTRAIGLYVITTLPAPETDNIHKPDHLW